MAADSVPSSVAAAPAPHQRCPLTRNLRSVVVPWAKRPRRPKVTKAEYTWRWTKSVGVLILMFCILILSIAYSGEESEENTNRDILEKRSKSLRNRLDKERSQNAHFLHFHDGISSLRKAHGTLRKQTNVILIGYPYGLSLTGDLMTAAIPDIIYFKEQPHSMTVIDKYNKGSNEEDDDDEDEDEDDSSESNETKNKKNWNNRNATLQFAHFLKSLFKCKKDTVKKFINGRSHRRNDANIPFKLWQDKDHSLAIKCLRSGVKLLETTHLRMRAVLRLLNLFSDLDKNINFKVIHLIGDPRFLASKGYLTQMASKRHENKDTNGFFPVPSQKQACRDMVQDIEAGHQLEETQYLLLRVEYLEEDPHNAMDKIYKFLNLPKERINFQDIPSFKSNPDYKYSYENWKAILPSFAQRKIDSECRRLLKVLDLQNNKKQHN